MQYAPTAEALMRSRFCAYVLNDIDYLLTTWHPDQRPSREDMKQPTINWKQLKVIHTKQGNAMDKAGVVEFVAQGLHEGQPITLHETSRFTRLEDQWVYVDGTIHPEPTKKISRNAPCPCGSGKKYKRCCGK
jgi:SEC-C motif-containing protein